MNHRTIKLDSHWRIAVSARRFAVRIDVCPGAGADSVVYYLLVSITQMAMTVELYFNDLSTRH
jgi:hypothetical protein